MKLHLPTGLRAALIAAITAVGFTLSQAAAAETQLNLTVPSGNQLTGGNSSLNWEGSTNDGLSSWKLAFSLDPGTAAPQDIFNLNASSTAATGYHLSLTSTTTLVLRDNGGNQLASVDLSGQTPITLSFVKNVDEGGVSLGTGTFYLSANGVAADPATVTQIGTSGANNTTFHFGTGSGNGDTRLWTNGGKEKFYDIALYQLDDFKVVVPAYEWNAADSGDCTWNTTSKIWIYEEQPAAYVENSDAKFTSTAAYKTVVINSAITAANVSVSANYTFDTSATLTASKLTIASDSTLTVNGTGSVTANELVNKGTLNIGEGAAVTASAALTLANGEVFKTTGDGTLNLPSVTLNGGTLDIASNLNVTAEGARTVTTSQDGNASRILIKEGTTKVTGGIHMKGGNGSTIEIGTDSSSATLVTGRLEVGDNGSGTSYLTIKNGSALIVTSTNDAHGADGDYKNTGLLLSEWGQQTHTSVAGKLYAQNVNLRQGNQPLNITIEEGGEVAVKGINKGSNGRNANSVITMNTGGKLILGADGMANDGGEWNITLNGGEVGMTADTTLARAMTVSGSVTFNTAVYTWTGEGADLALNAGSTGGTITVSGNITGDGTITKEGVGTLTFNGDANVLNNTINVQSGTLELNGTFSIDGNSSGLTTSYSDADHAKNGFKTSSGTVTVYTKEAGATVTVGGDAVFLYGPNNPVELDENGKCQISAQTDYTTFYVNEAEESVSTAKKRAEMQDIVLAENTTLNVDADFNGEHIDIVSGTATVNIASDKTLTAIADGATITGAGTYVLESSSVVGGKVTMSDTLGEGWIGIVQIHDVTTSATTQNDFTPLSKDGSTIELKGFNGLTNKWLSDQTENIKLTNSDDRGYAWYYSAATSKSGTSTFSGDWSGDGTLQTAGNKLQYKFIGDISAWEGKFQVVSGTPTLTFAGESNVVKAAIDRNNNTLNVVVDTTADATFSNTVDVSSLSVAAGKTATFQKNSSAGQLIGAGTVKVTGTDTILTITGAAGTSSTAAVTVDPGATLELAVGNALGGTQVVTSTGNVLIHETLTGGQINGGVLTLSDDFDVDGGEIKDVDDQITGNGFVQSGTIHVYDPSTTASLDNITKIKHLSKEYELAQVVNGDITLDGADWNTYQINQVNASQPAVAAIMAYASKNGGTLEHIIVNVANPEWEPELTVNLTNDSDKLKASMLGGEHLYNLRLNMADGANLTIDGDCAATIGTEVGANASIALTTDATIGSLSVAGAPEEAAVQLTITGKDHTLKTGGLGLGFDATLTIDEGVKVELLPETSFSTIMNATVKLGAKAALVLNEVSFATVADGTEATIEVISDEYIPMYAPHIAEYNLTGARITFNTSSDFELGHVIDSTSQVVNAGSGKMTDISANAAYDELAAQGGDIDLTNKEGGLALRNLTVGENRTVAMQTEGSIITVSGTAKFGAGAKVSSALTMANGATLDGTASLVNHDLDLTKGLLLSDGMWDSIKTLTPGDATSKFDLFTDVKALTLGGSTYTEAVDLTTIFSHDGLTAKKYSLSYDNGSVFVTRNKDNDRYWKGGTNTWDYSIKHWTDEDGSGNEVAFEEGYNAYFTNTTDGTVTLGGNITAASISVSGADYTFNPGGFTLTVTDSVEVSGEHTATFNMGLSGADTLKLVAKDKGKLVLNENSSVKTVEIGAGSTVTANKALAVAGNVVNNGTLEANATTSIGGNLSLGDQSTVSGTGTVNSAGVMLQGVATVSGELVTGTLAGTGTLKIENGKLSAAILGNGVGLATSGTTTITSTAAPLRIALNGTVDNASDGTVTFVGNFDVGNCTTVDGDAVYVGGEDAANGFKKAQKIVSIIDEGTADGTNATLTYNGTAIDKMDNKGKVTFDGTTEYDKFYVNSGSEKVSTALDNPDQELGSFVLANTTTLEVDKNNTVAMSQITLAPSAAANLVIDSGSTVTTDGTAKALTLKGAGTLAVDAGKTATGVTLDNTWTGTVAFSEAVLNGLSADAYNTASKVSLTGVTGSLGSTPIEAAIILNKGTDDWGFGQTAAGTQVVTLNGAITGDGNLGVKSSIDDSAFNLNGNIDDWTGNFIANADTRLTLGGSGAKTVNGTVSGTDLKVIVNADTTFNGALNVENLVMGTSKEATLQVDSTVDEVNASSGTLKVADGKKLTVIVNAHPEGIKLGVGSSIILKDDAYMGGNDYGYYGGTVANGTDLEQPMDINNAGITVTDTTLGTTGNTAFSVHNNLVNASFFTLNELQQAVVLANVKDSLEIVGDLAIGATGSLKVADGDAKQDVNISSASSLITAAGAQMDANLIINNGVTANMGGALDMNGGALTLIQSATLTGNLYDQIAALEGSGDSGKTVDLFTEVSALTLGNTGYSEPVTAALYFSNLADLDDKGDYLLEYNDVTGIVSIRFESTSAHTLTWNGTATEHRWVQNDDTVTDWWEGSPDAPAYFQEGDNAKFTADAAEKTVTIEQDITARNITIDSPDCYTFENSDDYSITAQKFEMTGHDGLAKTGEGKLTLDIIGDVSLTESALMVQEGSLEIGTAAKSGKLDLQASALVIAKDAELSVASIEGDGTSSIELAGTMTVSEGTVSNLTATEGSTLKIADLGQTTAGTLSVKTDTTLYGLENGGTLDLGNKTLNLMEKTEQGGNVTAGKLNLAENGNEFKELGTNRVTYAYGSEGSGQLDADAPNLVVDSIAPTMVIPSIALDVTEAMGDGGSLGAINRLGDEVTYTLIHANNGLGTVGFTLDDDKLHELIQNGLLSADGGLEKTENDVTLTVGGLDLTWNTSKDETEWGYKVVDETGALTDGANTLNGVQHVVVDSSRTVDVTGVGSEPGLRVRNLAGLDGRTITFSGEEGDTVNLITTEETASNVNLVAQNITVKVGLDELDAMDPVDYKDLRVGNVDLKGSTLAVHAYEDLDAAFTVNSLSGDGNSMLKGRVIVEGKGGAYRGGYENAYVILHENAEQLLYAGKGLTVAGLGAAKLAYVGPEAHMDAIEGINMTVTLNDPKQDNSGATLVLDKPSWLVDGTIISGMSAINSAATLDTAGAPNLVQAAGLNLDGTTIILNQDAVDDSVMAMAVNGNGKTKDLYLAHLGAEDSNTDRVLLNGYLYNKYYQNARLQGGKLLVDRRNAFFTEDVVRPTTVNGRAGSGMLDDALLEINPQATNPQGDLAAVMTALETNAVVNPDRVAAAVAGASAAALGHAFNNDVQRQLRAIRNRTTTMGLAECVKHEGLPYVNAWVNAEGDYRKLDADGTLAGYTLSSWGGTIGCDVDLTGRLTVGAAFTVLHGEFTSHSADMCEGDLDRDYVSLFARYGYRAWTHTFVATLGFAKSKVDRTVNYGTGSYTTRGDSDGNAFGFLYEVGYTKALNEDASTCLQPIFNVNYRHSSLGGYTEKGSDAALSVGSADMDAVTFGLGARLQSIVGTSVYNRATLFEGRVLAKLDAGDRDCTTNSSLIGVSAKRSVKSAEVGAFGVEVGAGLTIPVGETGGSIFMDVTGDFRSGYTEFNGTVGYRFSF